MKYIMCQVKTPVNCPNRKTYIQNDTTFSNCALKQMYRCKCESCNDNKEFPTDCPLIEIGEYTQNIVTTIDDYQCTLNHKCKSENKS